MKIGITIGDPAGIGPEVTLKSLQHLSTLKFYRKHQFFIFSSIDAFSLSVGKSAGTYINQIKQSLEVDFIPIRQILPKKAGTISPEGGRFSVSAIEAAVDYFQRGVIDALVTGPIDKQSLKLAKITQIDHTAILKKLTSVEYVDTLFKTGGLWIYFYSKHIPFKDITKALSIDKLVQSIRRFITYNHWIGLEKDKPLAVAALNPHAGDGGRFGNEEKEIIMPAVKLLQLDGVKVEGPIPADSVFALAKSGQYSAVVSLYHDQGHIAAKTLDFHGTVSFSPGMPFLRTSVDHGSAMNIAGKNIASELSMIQALKMAVKYGCRYKKQYSLFYDI